MAQVRRDQREALRQRLLAWARPRDLGAPEPIPQPIEEDIEEQIDLLLDEVLHDAPLVQAEPQPLDESEDDRRIVVTGLGLVTPFGLGIAPFWEGLQAGASAIGPITLCDASPFAARIAGEVPDFAPLDFLSPRDARRMARSSQFAVAAARLAVDDAGLLITEDNCSQVGALIGCGASSFADSEQAVRTLHDAGPRRIHPFTLPMLLPAMGATQVALQLGLHGHTAAPATTGAASAQAIGEAAAIIRRGDADVMLAGGSEAPISPLALAGYSALRVLSTRNDDPAAASRPFDAERDGFVLAEGAGVLVLERLSHARQRGATIYAELPGYASTCDAYHMVTPDPHGRGLAEAMRRALRKARLDPQQVDYISAHASSTRVGDLAETLAIKHVFGEYAFSVPVSAAKSMIGNLTGAAGAVGSAAALLALTHDTLPPTINQESPDADCDLDYVPNMARPAELQTVLVNASGFGGIHAVLAFQRVQFEK